MIYLQNYINGELVAPIEGRYIDGVNPATGKVYSQIPASNQKDVDNAYQAAKAAFPAWSAMGINERSAILMRIADCIDNRCEELARAESTDNG
ncbi:MAG: aldehyde dehydrogenase family protein, partial [Bacteroidetes bacterium]|nr:aldehyde dehydrogenase family protein [Bacteroidota bacterium]